jgi:hypothetical protein
MLADRLETRPAVELEAAVVPVAESRWSLRHVVAAIVGFAAYTSLAAYILASNTARVYGFPISRDLRSLIEITFEICPMLAAFVLVLLLPVKERVVEALSRRMHRTTAVVAASVCAALIATVATAAAIAYVAGPERSSVAASTLLWVAGEFAFDLTMIGVFTSLLYAGKRSMGIALLLFVAYIIAVMIVGPKWGITSYIGFGSNVPVMLTSYSTMPLYDRAAWLLRGYWLLVTLAMLAVLQARRVAMVALCGVIVLAATGLMNLQRRALVRQQIAPPTVDDAAIGRLQLNYFDLDLAYAPKETAVVVRGVLTLRNGGQPLPTAYFQMPALISDLQFTVDGIPAGQVKTIERYIEVRLSASQDVRVRFQGTVRPAGPFDLAVQGKVLNSAFFLTDADILPVPRRAGCFNPMAACDAENYLMSDRATGRISVTAPAGLQVVTAGTASEQGLADGTVRHEFTIAAPQLATFLVACAPFRESTRGTSIRVFRAQGTSGGDLEASLAERILAFYNGVWPAYPGVSLNIVEMPTALGEAMAFPGTVALSDKIISSRSPGTNRASDLLEFVMAPTNTSRRAASWTSRPRVATRSGGTMLPATASAIAMCPSRRRRPSTKSPITRGRSLC